MSAKFVSFVEQYFPKYLFKIIDYYDMKRMAIMECSESIVYFEMKYKYGVDVPKKI